jgi:hypothetical protein
MPKRKIESTEITSALYALGVSVVDALKIKSQSERNLSKEVFERVCGTFLGGKLIIKIEFDNRVGKTAKQ